VKRREFITLFGDAAATWPLAARAQQSNSMRRIGVLMSTAADDPEGQARIAAFHQGLQQLGWTIGQNVWIDSRWPAGDPEHFRTYAAEVVGMAAARPGLPVRLDRAPQRGAAFAITRASRRARTRSIGSRSRAHF
jgi:putative ABC transport system substrate-binding protein